MRDDSGVAARRTVLIIVLVAGAIAVLIAAGIVMIVLDYGTCSGDGGSPYSAEDSIAGDFCDGPLRGPWQLAMLVVPFAVVVVVGVLAVRSARAALLAVGVVSGLLAAVALAVPVVALPNNCSDSDQRAYDRWLAGGQKGERPAECETY
jgi:hypothetical protein